MTQIRVPVFRKICPWPSLLTDMGFFPRWHKKSPGINRGHLTECFRT